MSDPTLDLFARGTLLGFSIAAPVGPIGVLCIRRTLAEGRLSGFVSGLGAATADSVYGVVAASGLSWLTGALIAQQGVIRAVGGVLLIALGVRTWMSRPAAEPAAAPGSRGLLGNWATTFALTISNPMTILAFAAAFAALGLGAVARGPAAGATLVAGVFLGSAAWWLLLSGAVGAVRHTFDAGKLAWVNRASAGVLVGFGLAALLLPAATTKGPV